MRVYLDNAATTNVSKEVMEAMLPYFTKEYGNPSSLHDLGIANRRAINSAKIKIARLLNCERSEIYFTSCGTESINFAIKGLAFKNKTKGEIITTRIEHHATVNTCLFLEELGYIINYVNVDNQGFIDLEHLRSLITDNTLVVSIIMANNEVGTIQNIEEISKICEEGSTYLHLDAVQAATHIPLDLEKMNIDLMSISAHKFHGPKGIGVLYIKKGTNIENLIHGGQQELKLRSGTENVPFMVGFAKALDIGIKEIDEYKDRVDNYAKLFLEKLDKANVDYILNGPAIGENRLPGNINISIKDMDGTVLAFLLNRRGVFVSTGSACDSESIKPSHVITELNVPGDYINGTLRITIGSETTLEMVKYAAFSLTEILRSEV